MRIAFVNSVAGFGSTGRIVWQLSQLPGVQGRIYFGRKDNLTDADVFRITRKAGNLEHAFCTFFMDRQGFCNTSETEKMVENLKNFRPDLVHLHNLHGYYLNCETLFRYLKESGVPVVWTFHDCWPFTGHCAHYDSLDCDRWKTKCQHCPGTMRYPFTINGSQVPVMYEKKKEVFCSLSPNQLSIVTPSNWLEDQVRMSFLGSQYIRTIHNGIDHSSFHYVQSDFRSVHHLENDFLILAVAGVWNHEKGLDDLVRWSHQMKDHQKLIVVGGPKHALKKFDPAHTITIPYVNGTEELCRIYSAADVMVNLTLEDTFPTVNLEAQACGTPVLTYQTGGSPESITPKTGMVIEKGNLESMIQNAEKIQNQEIIFSSPDCMRNARRFDVRNMLNSYRALYEEKTGLQL